MLDDIRTYARLQLEIQHGMTRAEYVAAVRAYAVERHGEDAKDIEDLKMIAERTARHRWDSRRT